MAFIDNLKQLFGLGTYPAKPETPPAQASNVPAPTPPNPSGMPTTPRLRESLYRFIVEKLGAYSSETDGLPTGLKLWVRCADTAEEDRMAVALYAAQPNHFRNDLSRHLADQYIRLAPNWTFSWQFVHDELPAVCSYQQGNLGLEVIRPATSKPLQLRVRTLKGQTTQTIYVLDPAQQTEFRVGRGRTVETASGRVRTNDIAFLDPAEPGFDPERGEPNASVSRQHATIRYDAEARRYRLMADAGGLPANGNKTKILRADDTVERADLPGVGYTLSPGDQIELGGEAKLLLEGI
ncbi:FHA domain-containing protein [Fibrivirga algicola]|uniref:FHA domain-containing protein n=1 Tax=Fibrivirga algicola TaxID=2950420 RepID=A0ABX0QIU9_9BACT|nr:FHA domain-containing protein [Fibrivirga algicola]NID12370.1 FHA domain-containing protein [Fibrivirga algicola]